MSAVPQANTAPSSALARITASRARLREAMRDKSADQGNDAQTNSTEQAAEWIDQLKLIPGASVLFNTLYIWWEHHPMRVAVMATTSAAKAVIKPAAQRHPISLVLSAAALGALFAWSRPWRWVLKPALAMGLVTRLAAQAMPHIPSETWGTALAALLKLQAKPVATRK